MKPEGPSWSKKKGRVPRGASKHLASLIAPSDPCLGAGRSVPCKCKWDLPKQARQARCLLDRGQRAASYSAVGWQACTRRTRRSGRRPPARRRAERPLEASGERARRQQRRHERGALRGRVGVANGLREPSDELLHAALGLRVDRPVQHGEREQLAEVPATCGKVLSSKQPSTLWGGKVLGLGSFQEGTSSTSGRPPTRARAPPRAADAHATPRRTPSRARAATPRPPRNPPPA